MRAALLLALLLSLAILPPSATAQSWSVDGTLVVGSATKASLYVTISGLTNTRLTYSVPEGATFVEARDTAQEPVTATVSGDDVEVHIRNRPVTLRYDVPALDESPLTHFRIAPLGAGTTSATTMRLTLADGWTYVGAADRTAPDPSTPTASGTFTRTGGGFFDYVLARPGLVVPAPDPTVGGSIVKRVANASVASTGVHVILRQTYDTDVYSRDWQMPIPEGATGFAVRSPLGPIEPQIDETTVRVRAPYPTGYHLGARDFTIEYDLPAPAPHGGAFQRANVSIRAQDGDDVWLGVSFADGLTPTGALVADGAQESAPWEFHGRGPLFVGAAFLSPVAPGRSRFTEGLFLVDTPASMEEAARVTARNASELLPHAASFAVDGAIERPFAVAFTEADVFGWEAGFYSNGINTISIRARVLQNTTDAPRLEAVGVLVHEATHGLIDRLMPDAPHGVALLHEGLARLAETRAEAAFPSEVMDCNATRTRCQRESARPDPEEVRDYLRSGVTLDEGWTTATASEAERAFLYDYSGLVMHNYALRSPQGALAAALRNLSRQTFEEDAPDTATRVVDTLLAHAPGTPRDALLYPGKTAAQLPLEEFHYCMYGLVAPGYPWEGDGRAPAAGCPASGYGPSDAPLPELPPERESGVEPAPLPPTPSPLPPEPEIRGPDATGEGLVGGNDAAGAVVDAAPGSTVGNATPGLGFVALLAGIAVVAALTRRS